MTIFHRFPDSQTATKDYSIDDSPFAVDLPDSQTLIEGFIAYSSINK